MRMTRTDGTIIELTVEEYNKIGQTPQETSQKATTTPRKAQYMKEYMRTYRQRKPQETQETGQETKGKRRESSGKRWKKYEDKIIRNNTINEAQKQLPTRTRISIYARRSKINASRHYNKQRTKAKPDDKRILMMKFINQKAREIEKVTPTLTKAETHKLAFVLYKQQKEVKP